MLRRILLAAGISALITTNSWAIKTHSYTFEGNANDSTGTAHATLAGTSLGTAEVLGGALMLGGDSTVFETAGVEHYASLPAASLNLSSYSQLTMELWSTGSAFNTGFSWGFGYGRFGMSPDDDDATNPGDSPDNGQNYLMMNTIVNGGNDSRAAITNDYFNNEIGFNNGGGFIDGQLHHWVVTIETAGLDNTTLNTYLDGALVGTATGAADLDEIADVEAFLGRSFYVNDGYYGGLIHEFNIYDNALSAGDVTTNFGAGPVGAEGPTFTIDRTTGEMFLSNQNANFDVTQIVIQSASGALDPSKWLSVTDEYDSNNGGEFDSDGSWSEVTSDNFTWQEFDSFFGDGGDLGAGLGASGMQVGDVGAWTASPAEDVTIVVEVFDGTDFFTVPVTIEYVNGDTIPVGDLNSDGQVTADDWPIFIGNHLTDLSAMTPAQSYAFGDLDGDSDNDFNDFLAFKDVFDAANGAGAFQAMLSASTVPEPTTAVMLLSSCAAILLGRRRVA